MIPGTTIIESSSTVRTLSSDAALSALVLSDVDFGTFDPATTDYAADVANDVLETTVTPTSNHSGASYVIRLGGFEAAAGEFSLEVGDNVITVEVTAEDGEDYSHVHRDDIAQRALSAYWKTSVGRPSP